MCGKAMGCALCKQALRCLIAVPWQVYRLKNSMTVKCACLEEAACCPSLISASTCLASTLQTWERDPLTSQKHRTCVRNALEYVRACSLLALEAASGQVQAVPASMS